MGMDEVWPWIVTALLGLVVAVLAKIWWSQSRNEPPGPWGFPVVGYLPFLGRKMNVTINKLAKKYGNVYQLNMGSRKVVVISGQKAIQEALLESGTTFSGRPDFYTYVVTTTFGFANFSPAYRLYRKNTMKSVKSFLKLHQRKLQQVVHNSVTGFRKEIEATNGEPFDPKPLLFRITCSITGYICYGKVFDIKDTEVTAILEEGQKFGTYIAFGIICDFLPWAKFLLKKKLQQFERFLKDSEDYARKMAISGSKEGSDETTLEELFCQLGEEMSESEKAVLRADDTIVNSFAYNMFGAGFGTVASMFRYGLMVMALNPDVQSKAQEELDRVVGTSRFPDFEDKEQLPFTFAVVTEMHRHYSFSALGVTHATTCDTKFRGYSIAKGTPVVFNYYSINRGEDVFSQADLFKPERFLKDDGSFNITVANLVVPFGLGQRRCAGEQLAHFEIFTFFATILQQFVIEESPAHPLDLDDYTMTLGIEHNPYKVIIRSRKI